MAKPLLPSALLLALFTCLTSTQVAALNDDDSRPTPPPGRSPHPSDEPEQEHSTDHERVVGTFGVGFFGVMELPLFGIPTACEQGAICAEPANYALAAPTVGARYWLSEGLGVEAALAFGVTSAPHEFETSEDSGEVRYSDFGVGLHLGLPIALAYGRHFTFQVVPQLNTGVASGSYATATDSTYDLTGWLLEAGTSVGGEIHFGFLHLPQLALQGNVGLWIRHEQRRAEDGHRNAWQANHTRVRTFVTDAPWELFRGQLTAIYYF